MLDLKKAFEKNHITPGDILIVACSGGPDSMFLLEHVRKVHTRKNIIVAHATHTGFREGAKKDREFVLEYCKKHGLLFEETIIDADQVSQVHKTSVENACRIARREFFEALLRKKGALFILTAHHADDQVETIIYRLIRGTKTHGLSGIKEIEGIYFRPLLGIKKSHILDWLKKNSIDYCIDESNEDERYLRNHIRKHITPEFGKINPEYQASFTRLATYMQEMSQWIDDQFDVIVTQKEFTKSFYENLHPFMRSELIRVVYASCNNGTIGLSESNIDEIMRFIEGEHGNKSKELSNLKMYKKGGIVSWQ